MALALAASATACDAPSREQQAEICGNAIDDDGDGQVDCADSDCRSVAACASEICGNDLDDDHDGRFDCADSDCATTAACGGSDGRCGNAKVDPGEDCDGTNLGGRTCITQGFKTGALACAASCTLDTSGCSNTINESCANQIDDDGDGKIDCADPDCTDSVACHCGNGVLDEEELCDGTLLQDGLDCQSQGFPGGTLKCADDCQGVDTSSCTAPTCGDGIVSTGETCDDGNTTPDDGCSATCQVEVGPLCTAAPAASIGANQGDTHNGSNGFTGSCVGSGGAERVYTFTPAHTGTLIVVMASMTDQGVYVRRTCTDGTTELACANAVFGAGNEALTVPVEAGVPVSIVVDSDFDPLWGSPQEGPYTLTLALNPQGNP